MIMQTIHGAVASLTGSTTFDAYTASSGDSFTVINYAQGSRAFLLDGWCGFSGAAGSWRIRSPQLHDNQQGIRMSAMFNPTLSGADGDPQITMPRYAKQPLTRGDSLIVEGNGTATNSTVVALQMFYENGGSSTANLHTWAEIAPRVVNLVGLVVSPTAGASQAYGTSVSLTNVVTQLKADTDYAWLGVNTQLPVTSVGLRGPDTGNYRIACPGHWDQQKSSGYLADLSVFHGMPTIPVIQGTNQGATLVDAIDAATNVATVATLFLAELA